MQDTVLKFDESLADDFPLLFADWEKEVRRQGEVLNAFIRRHLGMGPLAALDCSCGIGTQAIGLALYGYHVHATDASPAAIARARKAAAALGAALTFEVADVRALNAEVVGKFDVVLSCENALPHFLADADLLLAARQMRTRLRRDGLLLIGIHDYDQALQGRRPPALNHFILRQRQNKWQTDLLTTKHRALRREELTTILQAAGFSDICWHLPAASGFIQPLVTARKK
jgi:2-polyprenyl-3-methyl-5-hydroxy-6-metoxy-1,4-benzoquinol methylase